MAHRHDSFFWQPAPLCFACGRELGPEPGDAIYMGWGRREGREDPAWVATLCPGHAPGPGEEQPTPCVATAREYASAEGQELTADEYRRWLETA